MFENKFIETTRTAIGVTRALGLAGLYFGAAGFEVARERLKAEVHFRKTGEWPWRYEYEDATQNLTEPSIMRFELPPTGHFLKRL